MSIFNGKHEGQRVAPRPQLRPRAAAVVVEGGAAPAGARVLYRSTRKNAAVRGIPFDLSLEEFSHLWWASRGVCALTGIALDLTGERRGDWGRNPWAPSVDRVQSNTGYTAQNCRIVCAAVNIALNEWGAGVLMQIASALHGRVPIDMAPVSHKTGLAPGIYRMVGKSGRVTFRVRPSDLPGRPNLGTFRTYEEALAALHAARSRDIGLI